MAINIGATLSLKNGNFFTNIKSATSAVGGLKSALGGGTNALKTHGKAADSVGGRLKSLAGKVVGVVAAYASFSTIKNFVSDAITLANEQNSAETRLQTTLSNVEGVTQTQISALQSYASTLQKVTTIGDEVTIHGMSQLGTFQLQADTIKTLTPALQDLAVSQYGVNVSSEQMQTTANLVGKVMTGSVSALTRYGVVMNDTQKKILQTGTESERAAMLVDVLKQNFGGLSEAMAKTPEGRIQQLKNAWGDMKEVIGAELYPVLTRVLTFATDKIPTVQNALQGVINGAKGLYNAIAPALSNFVGALRDIGGAVTSAFSGMSMSTNGIKDVLSNLISAASSIVRSLEPIVQSIINVFKSIAPKLAPLISGIAKTISLIVARIAPVISKIVDVVGGVLGAIVGFLSDHWGTIQPILDFIIIGIAFFSTKVIDVFSGIISLLGKAFSVIGSVITAIWNKIKPVVTVLTTYITGEFSTAWSVIQLVWNGAVGFFSATWDTIKGIFSVVKDVLTGNWSGAWEGIKGIVNTWGEYFSGVWEGIKGVFSSAVEWFGSTFAAAWEAVKGVFSAVGSFFMGVWNTIKQIFTTIGLSVADAVSGAFRTVVNSVIGFAENLINGFIKSINSAIGVINKISPVDIPLIPTVNLPKLAKGGIATRSTVAEIGERGTEAVLPLKPFWDRLDRALKDRSGTESSGGRNNVTVNLNVTIPAGENDPESLADKIINVLMPKLKMQLANL